MRRLKVHMDNPPYFQCGLWRQSPRHLSTIFGVPHSWPAAIRRVMMLLRTSDHSWKSWVCKLQIFICRNKIPLYFLFEISGSTFHHSVHGSLLRSWCSKKRVANLGRKGPSHLFYKSPPTEKPRHLSLIWLNYLHGMRWHSQNWILLFREVHLEHGFFKRFLGSQWGKTSFQSNRVICSPWELGTATDDVASADDIAIHNKRQQKKQHKSTYSNVWKKKDMF